MASRATSREPRSASSTDTETVAGGGSSTSIDQQAAKRALSPTEEVSPSKKQKPKMIAVQARKFGTGIHKLWDIYKCKIVRLEEEMQGYIKTLHYKSLTDETEIMEWYRASLKELADEEAKAVKEVFDSALTTK